LASFRQGESLRVGMLDVSPTAVKGLLQRGRAALDRQRPAGPDDAPEFGSSAEHDLARRFADAFSTDDVDGVVALLTNDAWLTMPPAPHEYQGPPPSLPSCTPAPAGGPGRQVDLQSTRANGQLAFASALAGGSTTVLVLTPRHDRISRITHFLDPRLPALLGLPTPARAE